MSAGSPTADAVERVEAFLAAWESIEREYPAAEVYRLVTGAGTTPLLVADLRALVEVAPR